MREILCKVPSGDVCRCFLLFRLEKVGLGGVLVTVGVPLSMNGYIPALLKVWLVGLPGRASGTPTLILSPMMS